MDKLTELVELAKKATPGEWRRASTVFNGITATPFTLEFGKEAILANCPEKRDALFIAAANPETILAIAEAFRELERRAEAAEAEVEDTDKTMRAYSDQLVKVTAELVAAQAQLAALAKQEPVACKKRLVNHRSGVAHPWTYHGKVDWPSSGDVFRVEVLPLYEHPAPAAVPVDLLSDESGLADRHIAWLNTLQRSMFSDENWEELTLYTWLAFRDSFRIHQAEMLRRIEGLK